MSRNVPIPWMLSVNMGLPRHTMQLKTWLKAGELDERQPRLAKAGGEPASRALDLARGNHAADCMTPGQHDAAMIDFSGRCAGQARLHSGMG